MIFILYQREHRILCCVHVINAQKRTDMHCEIDSRNEPKRRYYFEDPLWDGEGCEGRMSAVIEEDRGSVSSCLNQLRTTLR